MLKYNGVELEEIAKEKHVQKPYFYFMDVRKRLKNVNSIPAFKKRWTWRNVHNPFLINDNSSLHKWIHEVTGEGVTKNGSTILNFVPLNCGESESVFVLIKNFDSFKFEVIRASIELKIFIMSLEVVN